MGGRAQGGGEDLGHGHLRLLSLLLEQLLQQLDLVSGGQRRPRAQARGLRGRRQQRPGRGGQHGLWGVSPHLEEREGRRDLGEGHRGPRSLVCACATCPISLGLDAQCPLGMWDRPGQQVL